MVRPRSEQIVPGLVEPRAIGAVHHVVGEERVAALILHLQHERVVLGAVVGVVERRRHRILVGGIRLAVRVRRQRARRTRPCRRGTSCSRRSSDRRRARAGWRRAPMPSGRSEIITRTTALRSLPSSASAWNSSDVAAGRDVDRERRRCRSSRSRPARVACRRGSCRSASAAAASAGSNDRSGCVERIGPACPRRHRQRARRRGGGAGAPRPAGAARVIDARVAPDDDRRHARRRD